MKNEIVIARYSENLDWVGDIPGDFAVTIYNKGAAITSGPALERADHIVAVTNSGRESDTILRHIINKTEFHDGFTVFLQGDPFEHSPDIIALLNEWRQWRDLQPLSWCWIASKDLPPKNILLRETSAFVGKARVRPEVFSLVNWGPLQFFDPGARVMGGWYLNIHGLPDGVNIASHFLRRCEWVELAEQAERNLVGRYSYGALFAVRQERLKQMPRRSLELALEAANGHKAYGYILERLWLHMLGEPFLLPALDPVPYHEDLGNLAARFVGPDPKKPLHLRVVPAIKRRVAHWAAG